jgi:phosphate-selective porin
MKTIIILLCCVTSVTEIFSQHQDFKISGYLQAQYQYGEKDASLKVGGGNSDKNHDFNRIGVRRGRLKFEYEKKIASGVFQIDLTEKGVGLKDAYLLVKMPALGKSSIKTGVFNRPFGFEISHSSSRRLSPERSTVVTTLFPEERDLGAMLTLQADQSPWSMFKLELAAIAGNGIKMDIDNRKDYIGHLSLNKKLTDKSVLNAGISYYNGGVYQGTSNVYKYGILNNYSGNIGKFAKREYYGVDAQFKISTVLGATYIYSEYILGTQTGDKNSSKSPNYSALPTNDTYIRNFRGGYITVEQDLGLLPLSVVAKYDFYDPNNKIYKDEVGLAGSAKGDIAYQTFGCGLNWKINENMNATAYYEWITNERSTNLTAYNQDIDDNVFTLRLQYKF